MLMRAAIHGAVLAALLASCGPAPDPAPPEPAAAPDPETWRSELYPSDWQPGDVTDDGRFLHDFSYAGYRRGEADLPEPVDPTVDVTAFGADPTGETDSTAAIQAAIDSLTDGGTVHLPEGSYRCDDLLRVETDGVIVTGDGPDATFLWFTRTDGMTGQGHLTFAGGLQRGPDLPLAVDGPLRSSVVQLVDASSLQPGDEVAVGVVITDEFVQEHGMTETWQAFNGDWQPFFRRTVEAVDTSVEPHAVTLDIPLRYPMQVRDGASLRVETGYLREVGVRDLAVSTVTDWDLALALDRTHAVRLSQVADGFVQNIASFESPNSSDDRARHLLSGGVMVVDSKRVTVADSWLGHAQHRGGGGNGYLYEISRSGEVLVRDSEGVGGRHNFIQNWGFGTSGCVWLRVTSRDGFAAWDEDEDFGDVGLSEYHHSLAMANLVDDSEIDDGWGALNRHDWSSGAGHTATANAFWGVRGLGVVRSFQFGWGYVIGTDGLQVDFDIEQDGIWSPGEGTEPNDHVEGQGAAGSLRPESLYEDQRERRLGE